MHQPAHLDAAARIVRHQAPLAEVRPAGFVEIFGDDAGAGHAGSRRFDQHRRRSLGVEQQEFAPALPDPLLDEFGLETELAERQPNEPRMRAKGMMVTA